MTEEVKVEKVVKIYVEVPYHQKEMAKALWIKWDGERKQWYINVKDKTKMSYFQPVIFLFDVIEIVGVNASNDEVNDIKEIYNNMANSLMEDEEWRITKVKLYEKKKVKRVCNKCFKVDFMELDGYKCSECK
jgi:hypothetical protein